MWYESLAVACRRSLILLLSILAVASTALGQQAGYFGPSFSNGSSSPSGSKPQHKLWWNDGIWWGCLWDNASSDFYIFRLDESNRRWIRTNRSVDTRKGTRQDALWDDATEKLYVASHNFSESDGSGTSRLYRFSYDGSSASYSLDSGFPATINSVKSETLALAKDSTGQLWATWEQGGTIWVNRTLGGGLGTDASWGSPFALPGAATVNADDISSIIAFGGGRIGVFWSNQRLDQHCFATHLDTDGDLVWQPIEIAIGGANYADDHVNLKADSSGRVYAVVKTELLASSNPLILLLVRATNGTWSSSTVGRGVDDHTRAILLLDESNSLVRVYLTAPSKGGKIYEKTASMGSLSFPVGLGRVVINDPGSADANNVSSTQQNVNTGMGLYVVATNDTTDQYWTSDNLLVGGGNRAPSAFNVAVTTTAGSPVTITLGGSDYETLELTFVKLSEPASGSLSAISDLPGVVGSPNVDSATVVFTSPASSGTDGFTYKVTDGNDADSNIATVTVTIQAPSSPVADVTFEGGVLVGPQGASSQSGSATLETAAPLRGSYAVRFDAAAAGYLNADFTAENEVFTSLYVRLERQPAVDSRIVVLSSQGTTVGNLLLRTSGALRLRNGSTTIGSDSAVLIPGVVYRLGLHQKAGPAGSSLLEAFVAIEDQPFGLPFAVSTTQALSTAADRVRFGATTGAIDAVLDGVRVNRGALP